MLRSLLQACQPGLVLQALKQALDAHKAGRGNMHELEQGMRSDEQTQLGTWTTIAEQLPLWSGDDGGIELLSLDMLRRLTAGQLCLREGAAEGGACAAGPAE